MSDVLGRPSNTTAYGAAGYYANSFNDMGSAWVTCFELLIVNNWFVICDGRCCRALSTDRAVRVARALTARSKAIELFRR